MGLGKYGRNRRAQGVCQQDFLGQPDNKPFQSLHNILKPGMAIAEIGLHVLVFDNGALHQLREKHHVKSKFQNVLVGLCFAMPYIQQIRNTLEQYEREAYRDDYPV